MYTLCSNKQQVSVLFCTLSHTCIKHDQLTAVSQTPVSGLGSVAPEKSLPPPVLGLPVAVDCL